MEAVNQDDRFKEIVFSYSKEIEKTICKVYTQLKLEDIYPEETKLKAALNFIIEYGLNKEIKKWK
ncbi:hypothetical protein CIG2463D_1386 [Campylobacter iguaniorum]|uniref:hypothetical protein n=1 Tax=Campylobacter iguaniorum TaxID=1244531 RepID=UPI00073A4EA0|nr:hypothetical protein [Campylobacter iguaniorum]ALV24954.1 hypothetical protein CIG2463D_1386 [Campylobacter iguaniorum]